MQITATRGGREDEEEGDEENGEDGEDGEPTSWLPSRWSRRRGVQQTSMHGQGSGMIVAVGITASACGRTSSYWSLARTAERVGEHNFRYPRIRELTLDNDGIALGGQGALPS